MASPKFDVLHVQLSQRIDDAVTAATTDGDRISSAKRSQFLNSGIRNWMIKKVNNDITALKGMIAVESKALTASVLTLSSTSGWTGGVFHILDAVNTTPTPDVVVRRLPDELYGYSTLGLNKYLLSSSTNQFYTMDGNNFRILGGGATDTIQLRYVKLHPDLTANHSTLDIAIEEQYYDEILDEAYREYVLQYPSQDNTARLQVIGK